MRLIEFSLHFLVLEDEAECFQKLFINPLICLKQLWLQDSSAAHFTSFIYMSVGLRSGPRFFILFFYSSLTSGTVFPFLRFSNNNQHQSTFWIRPHLRTWLKYVYTSHYLSSFHWSNWETVCPCFDVMWGGWASWSAPCVAQVVCWEGGRTAPSLINQ